MNYYPTPELISEWIREAGLDHATDSLVGLHAVVNKAARWGANKELERCCCFVEYVACAPAISRALKAHHTEGIHA
jgi:hypothetical protein